MWQHGFVSCFTPYCYPDNTSSQNTLYYRTSPLCLPKGAPWNVVHSTYNCGLISNCLFLRIIPNKCAALAPFPARSQDYSGGQTHSAHVLCVHRNWCSFDLTQEIERFISTRNDTGIQVLFSFASGRFAVQLSVCAASCNPVYLHPLVLCMRPQRTRTWLEISAGSASQWWMTQSSHSAKSSQCISVYFFLTCKPTPTVGHCIIGFVWFIATNP